MSSASYFIDWTVSSFSKGTHSITNVLSYGYLATFGSSSYSSQIRWCIVHNIHTQTLNNSEFLYHILDTLPQWCCTIWFCVEHQCLGHKKPNRCVKNSTRSIQGMGQRLNSSEFLYLVLGTVSQWCISVNIIKRVLKLSRWSICFARFLNESLSFCISSQHFIITENLKWQMNHGTCQILKLTRCSCNP